MPTVFKDQFFFMDPAAPPPFGTALNFARLSMTDQNDDGDLDRFNNDSVNGSDITRSWPGDTITINVPGVGNVTYTGITFYLADGSRVFTPTDGQVLQNGTFVSSTFVNTQGPLNTATDLGPTCFTPGTMILTPSGERPIEDLAAGDLVNTRDGDAQPVLWIGRATVDAVGDHAPIRFEAGTLGATRALTVSPQHRMLIEDWRATYFFGYGEVLVAARHLVNGTTVNRIEGGKVDYIHLLFGSHQIVQSNGVASESYFPAHAVSRADRSTRGEIVAMFPGIANPAILQGSTARPVLRGREARLIAN